MWTESRSWPLDYPARTSLSPVEIQHLGQQFDLPRNIFVWRSKMRFDSFKSNKIRNKKKLNQSKLLYVCYTFDFFKMHFHLFIFFVWCVKGCFLRDPVCHLEPNAKFQKKMLNHLKPQVFYVQCISEGKNQYFKNKTTYRFVFVSKWFPSGSGRRACVRGWRRGSAPIPPRWCPRGRRCAARSSSRWEGSPRPDDPLTTKTLN